jgi:pyruvate dehydrogenase E2 component (dihydrolipoamide acetyltransferase)
MATPVKLPELGESVTEGTVTRWLKQVGDDVAMDEPLLEVSTDKVDTEIPSPVAGTLLEIKAEEDETVEVGAELALIGDQSEAGGSSDGGDSGEDSDDRADVDPDAGAESGAGEDQGTDDEPEDFKTETETDPPAAQTDDAPPAQETAPASADTKPEADASQAGTSTGSGTPVKLPELGESVTEGTVTRWLKQVGDDVAMDEPLLEVSTDKVDTEIPSPVAGTLLEIKVQEDETVEVGAELAVVGSGDAAPSEPEPEPEPEPQTEGEETSAPDSRQEQTEAEAEPEQQKEPVPSEEPTPGQQRSAEPATSSGGGGAQSKSADGGPYVTPLVRKMAADQGVDLSSIEGTGVGGRIRKQDVLDAAAAAKKAAEEPAPAASAPAAPAAQESKPAAGGGRHEHLPAPGLGEGRLRRARGCEAVVPAVLREGGRGLPQGAPVAERGGGHREGRGDLLRPREPLGRGGHREGTADPGHQGCG